MNNEELATPADNSKKRSYRWRWLWYSIVGVIIAKLFGFAGCIITIGAYYWLKSKMGTWPAVAIAGTFGLITTISLSLMLSDNPSNALKTFPNASYNVSISKPTFDTKGWTQENTGNREVGSWLNFSPPGTRYCRHADRTIQRLYPPGVRTNLPEANPFCLGESSESVPK